VHMLIMLLILALNAYDYSNMSSAVLGLSCRVVCLHVVVSRRSCGNRIDYRMRHESRREQEIEREADLR